MAELSLAVVGPTSLVGEEILEQLEARQLDADVRLLGSHRTAGGEVAEGPFAGKIALLGPSAFDGVDVALFAAGPGVAGEYAPQAARAGALVVDCSSRFRLDPQVPLVVPEVNADALGDVRERGIVATPSSTAIALAVVLAPLAQAGLRRVVVSTYHGVAGAGRRAVHGLSSETVDLLNGRGQRATAFARRIAFNAVPQVGALEPGGATAHESAAMEEVRRILDAPDLAMQVTAVRIPVFFGVGLSVALETEEALDPADAVELLRPAPGILLHETAADAYPTPVESAGSEATHVGRVRADPSVEHGLALWITIDSVVKGAGLNAVQVAELLARGHL
jgi:aspartate-semialdehyde dehydrogenase